MYIYTVDDLGEISVRSLELIFRALKIIFIIFCVVPLDHFLAALEVSFCGYCLDKIYV